MRDIYIMSQQMTSLSNSMPPQLAWLSLNIFQRSTLITSPDHKLQSQKVDWLSLCSSLPSRAPFKRLNLWSIDKNSMSNIICTTISTMKHTTDLILTIRTRYLPLLALTDNIAYADVIVESIGRQHFLSSPRVFP